MSVGFSDQAVHDKHEQHYERLKFIFLTVAFFCVIGAYTVAKELKNSVISYTVGADYVPWVRMGVMFALIPVLFLYSELVDKVRRFQVLCICSGIIAIVGLIFAYLLGNPDFGMLNTDESPYRAFGWFFYLFVESYSPFVVSVFWAFANSISSPEGAQKNYGFMVSGSKLGGMVTAALAWWWVTTHPIVKGDRLADVFNHQILLVSASLMLLMVPIVIIIMMKKIPGKYLHGYEAVYQVEKQRKKQGESQTGIFAGLAMLIKYPYVLGIFGMSFFYEMVSTVLSYLSVKMARNIGSSASESLTYLLEIVFLTHCVGFIISVFGTGVLFRKLGTKRCLLLIPVSTAFLLAYYMLNVTSASALLIALVVLRAINYAFSYPLRESLYIPTIKEIKFKSKSWIDVFGSKFAKTSGSFFNIIASRFGQAAYLATHSAFFAGIVGLWGLTAFLLGQRFERAVAKQEVIGVDSE